MQNNIKKTKIKNATEKSKSKKKINTTLIPNSHQKKNFLINFKKMLLNKENSKFKTSKNSRK